MPYEGAIHSELRFYRLAPRLIGEVGDITRFKGGSALIAFAGIDAPPYQSGQFYGTNRRISKRGAPGLRKAGYEIMKCLKTNKSVEDSVYCYSVKKEKVQAGHVAQPVCYA